MKKDYQKPEIETVNVESEAILAASNIGGPDAPGTHSAEYSQPVWVDDEE